MPVALLLGCGQERAEDGYARALALQRGGRLGDAIDGVNRALSIATRQESAEWRERLLLLRAELALDRGQDDQLPPTWMSSPGNRVRHLKVRAQSALLGGAADKAAEWLRAARAQAGITVEGGLDVELYALEARVAARRGRATEADRLAGATVDRARRTGDGHWIAHALKEQGLLHMQRQSFDTAMSLFLRSRDVARRSGSRLTEARSLLNSGICAYRLGDFGAARQFLQEAKQGAEELGAFHLLTDVVGEMGNVHHLQLESAQSAAAYEQALALARVHAPRALFRWTSNLAAAHISLRDWNRADELTESSPALLRTIGATQLLPYVKWQRALIAGGRGRDGDAERLLREVISEAGDLSSLRWQAEAELGRLLVRRGDPVTADRLFESTLHSLEEARRRLSRLEYRLTFLTSLIRLYDSYIAVLLGQGRVAEALVVAERSRARLLADQLGRSATTASGAAVPSIQRAAGRLGATVLAYWIGHDRSWLWAIQERTIRHFELPRSEQLRSKVDQYRRLIEDSLRDPRQLATSPPRELFDILVAPAQNMLRAGGLVIVAPDGPLHGLPFGALVTREGRFLVEDVQLAVAPALSLLPEVRMRSAAPVAGRRVLAIGDPLPVEAKFPRLVHASNELMSIADQLGEAVDVVKESEARPDAYLAASLTRYSIVHFAAHGVANEQNPLDSAIVLSPSARGQRLLLRDILNRRLRAELVTVSACRGAGGRAFSGEGLVGFAWGFLSTGARTVVAGLWDVSDDSTPRLMKEFYASIARGTPPAAALRDAQLSMLAHRRWATPYHWAAFNVYLGGGAVETVTDVRCTNEPCNAPWASRTP